MRVAIWYGTLCLLGLATPAEMRDGRHWRVHVRCKLEEMWGVHKFEETWGVQDLVVWPHMLPFDAFPTDQAAFLEEPRWARRQIDQSPASFSCAMAPFPPDGASLRGRDPMPRTTPFAIDLVRSAIMEETNIFTSAQLKSATPGSKLRAL